MVGILQEKYQGWNVAQLQTRLFHVFQYRLDGPELTKIITSNPKHLQMKRYDRERVYAAPVEFVCFALVCKSSTPFFPIMYSTVFYLCSQCDWV